MRVGERERRARLAATARQHVDVAAPGVVHHHAHRAALDRFELVAHADARERLLHDVGFEQAAIRSRAVAQREPSVGYGGWPASASRCSTESGTVDAPTGAGRARHATSRSRPRPRRRARTRRSTGRRRRRPRASRCSAPGARGRAARRHRRSELRRSTSTPYGVPFTNVTRGTNFGVAIAADTSLISPTASSAATTMSAMSGARPRTGVGRVVSSVGDMRCSRAGARAGGARGGHDLDASRTRSDRVRRRTRARPPRDARPQRRTGREETARAKSTSAQRGGAADRAEGLGRGPEPTRARRRAPWVVRAARGASGSESNDAATRAEPASAASSAAERPDAVSRHRPPTRNPRRVRTRRRPYRTRLIGRG